MNSINTLMKQTGAFFNKYSPQILMGAGALMTIGAVVTAVMAAVKTQPQIEELKKDVVDIHTAIDDGKLEKKEGKKELTKAYKETGLELAKHYALPLGLTIGSVGCSLSGFGILNKRYGGISVAFAGLAASYDGYRKRVVEALGEDKEKNIFLGLKDVTIKEKEVNPETGEVKKVKRTIKVKADDEMDPYELEFDGGPNYHKDLMTTKMVVEAQEKLAQIDHTINKTPMFLDEFLGRHYLNLPVKSGTLSKMRHCVGWPVGVTPACDPHIVEEVDEEGTVVSRKLMLRFVGLSGNPWMSPYPEEID